MYLPSEIVYDNPNFSLFQLFHDNQRNNNNNSLNYSFQFDEMNDTNMYNQNDNPTQLNPSPINAINTNTPLPLNNLPSLSRKKKRDENSENIYQTDRLESDLEKEEEEEEKSDDKISKDDLDNHPFKLNSEEETKSFTKDKIKKYPTKKELKKKKKIFSEGFTYIKDYNKFLNTLWRNIPAIYKLHFNSEIQNKFFGTCLKDYIEEILNEKKSQKDKELFPICPQELKYIFDNIRFNNASSFPVDLNINVERNNEISLDDIK